MGRGRGKARSRKVHEEATAINAVRDDGDLDHGAAAEALRGGSALGYILKAGMHTRFTDREDVGCEKTGQA